MRILGRQSSSRTLQPTRIQKEGFSRPHTHTEKKGNSPTQLSNSVHTQQKKIYTCCRAEMCTETNRNGPGSPQPDAFLSQY